MDLTKAFDVITHDTLKIKLEHYGFRGIFLSFIMDYLKDRKYCVCINGYKSDFKISNIGVPQGSTLGPLLFLLYINDIGNCSSLLKFILYADDTTVLFKSHCIVDLNYKLSSEVKKVLTWFSANNLLINLSKTNCMLFSNKQGNPRLSIDIDNLILEEKEVITFLGVEVDKNLTWKYHIQHICNKVSKTIAILRILRRSFPRHVLIKIYMSLIHSYISYCNVIWGSAYECHLNPLIVLQKKAVRIIMNARNKEHSAPLFFQLKLLPISKVYHLNCLKLIFKCLYNNSYPNLRKNISFNCSTHNHATRYRNQIKPIRERLEICRNSYLSQSIFLWNKLNENIKECKSLHNFKNKVKDLFLDELK